MQHSLSISSHLESIPIFTHSISKSKPKIFTLRTLSKSWSRRLLASHSPIRAAAAANARFRAGDLYQVISRCGNPTMSMARILDRWIDEGRWVTHEELRYLVLNLKRRERYKHALEVSEWYSSWDGVKLSAGDFAFHLDLVSKVHGIDHAEKYFRTIPRHFWNYSYKTLLNCYANAKSVEKSEALMQRMKSMGLEHVRIAFPYNVMMRLYRRLGLYEKMDSILDGMDVEGIIVDDFTYSIRLSAFVDACDIQGMESLLMKMEADPSYRKSWKDFIIAANGYIKGGLVDRAIDMLRKAELFSYPWNRQFAYPILLTVYARAACKYDVYRIWNLFIDTQKPTSKAYGTMVSSLIKLGDLEGAGKIIGDNIYDTNMTFFPINLLLRAYAERGDMKRAKALVDRGMQYRKKPLVSTWDVMATGYFKNDEMEAAVDAMNKIGMLGPGRVNKLAYKACLQHLRMKGDSKELEKFVRLLRDKAYYSSEASSSDHLKEKVVGWNLIYLKANRG
ncbi:hypothetical protein Droror1_Dr00003941 [Drosera rotundifolia]